MKLHGTMRINPHFHLEIGGCDCTELAKDFGTPLYIMDEQLIRENCRGFVRAFSRCYPSIEIVYAGKAFLTTAMAKIIESEGLSLDVVSGGELYTAYSAGFPMDRVYFHGNNKTPEEINMALEYGVGCIVVDNPSELEMLDNTASSMGVRQKSGKGITGRCSQHASIHPDRPVGFQVRIPAVHGRCLQGGKAGIGFQGPGLRRPALPYRVPDYRCKRLLHRRGKHAGFCCED